VAGDVILITSMLTQVLNEAPYLYPLSPHRSSTPHHGFTLLPKRVVDVKAVEFARALRLTDSTIEPINFVVPRVKVRDQFQVSPPIDIRI
jgi:hypothetical protein